jgi:hypothetical protein
MRPLTAAELLNAWERGVHRDGLGRARMLLRAARESERDEDPDTLTIGERDARLLTLREWTFGPDISAVACCPVCREELELQCQVSDLQLEAPKAAAQLSLSTDEYEIKFHLPNGADLIAARSTEGNCDAMQRTLLARCVSEAFYRGTAIPAETLPDSVIASLSERMAEADPQAEIEFRLACKSCGHQWAELFEVESFFWAEIQAWAARVLNEIHQLAAAYGWSESEILRLSAARRSAYLTMIAE